MIQYLPFHCVKETYKLDGHIIPFLTTKNIIFNSLLTLPPSPFSKYEKNNDKKNIKGTKQYFY